ncbi:MAG TPA: succinate dehydrogenase [Verrucomicrobiae bacterium]|nr:succinate dehydrogenase [Verrucomicrobiae bacterium]
MASASSTAPAIPHGVAPLRAGQGISFVLRRLHSLTGIIPVGAFLFEHILISNSTAISGPAAYARQVSFLANLPLVFFLELFGIWIPIAYHAGYGFYIWYRGDGNTGSYPWTGNWMYTVQRWTGAIAFIYIVWHVYTMRFAGVDLHENPMASFGKVQAEVMHTGLFLFYAIGLVAASWHFAYGIWLFCAKWGIVSGTRAQKGLLRLCLAFFLLLCGVGFASLYTFRSRPMQEEGTSGTIVEMHHRAADQAASYRRSR